MHGHEDIIRLRLRGSAPKFVFINDYQCKTDWFDFGDHATVCTAGDSIASLDLRFVAGLQVSLTALTERRAKALAKACKDAGATVVAACHIDPSVPAHKQTGWMEVWRAEEVAHG